MAKQHPTLPRSSERSENGPGRSLAVSVVMPAYNAAKLLPSTLPPLIEMLAAGEVAEVIVVNDRSPDNTARIAAELGAQVIETPVNGGPGAARNLAASQAVGDILWFVDSDVIAHRDGAERVRAAFADPAVGAVFGSYDSDPGDPHWFSRYKNLMHRYYHQASHGDATTFWAGCGAVRKDVFHEVGGFDALTYAVPSIEDIELGYRISGAGHRICLDPDLQGKHLKGWRVRNAIHTDIFCRALPWSRLMIAREGLSDNLNTSWSERMKAIIALSLLLSLATLVVAPQIWPIPLFLLALAILANWRFARFLHMQGGLTLAVPGVLYHQLYFAYSSITFAWCLVEYHLRAKRTI